MSIAISILLWNVLNLAYTSSVPRTDYGELKLFRAPATYSVDTTVLLNDASRKDKEVGYKIKASLDLTPVWSNGHSEFLLKFDLVSPQLHGRGTHIAADFLPHASPWDAHPHTTFYTHWKNGLIETSYLDTSEPVEIINYKKSLISLFQFQIIDGEHNETDISGTCKVMYETLSMQTIRKIKRECWSTDNDMEGGAGAQSRRLTRYSLSAALDALDELYAEELHTVGDAPAGLALKARAWQRLARAAPPAAAAAPPAPAAPARSLGAALGALPAALAPHTLQLHAPDIAFDDDMDLSEVVERAAAALEDEEAGAGGDAAAARAALRALPALRAAARPAALLRLLALAGSPAAHRAAAAFLQLHGADPLLALARDYLAALALGDAPHEEAVLDALRPPAAAALREPALLAAAAAAPRAGRRAARAVRDHLLKDLAKCKDDECLAVRLRALGNLRCADTAEPLLAQAERGAPGVALAALDALHALPAAALLRAAPLARLAALALDARSLDVRAAALDLLLRRSAPAPLELQRVALDLHARAPPELRRVFWQRLRALAPDHEAVRRLLEMLPRKLTGWNAQAIPGTSSVLVRAAGAAGGRAARLDSLQLAQDALLRRGRVALLALDASNTTEELFAVELWTRGLEALAGGSSAEDSNVLAGGAEQCDAAAAPGEAAAEDAGGGLALVVGGERLPALTLFDGQAELLGHVWAGRGSEPTGVLRAVRELRSRGGLLPLGAGTALRWRQRAALALALDAQAQVSLWSRSARSQLELRAALAAESEARVGAAPAAALAAHAALAAEPRLRIAADLDFYDGVALCVRVAVAAHERRRELALRARGARRTAAAQWAAPGRTLALGAPNDAACRTLGSSDD
ncbi:microsomal triacylglycerol transfer protein [Epargyreus clarus]|uniref:microsomal triacylglycerol transfer protein n=1 Tax=Epargyreus clarus TaxID=520877 RepID=UPI003C30A0D1